MRAWAEQAAGRDHAARAVVEPVLDGTVTSVLPHTVVEALLVEASARVTGGDVRTARRALRDALSSGASLGACGRSRWPEARPGNSWSGHVGRAAETEPFAARALAASRRPDTRTARLDDGELRLLARLPSPTVGRPDRAGAAHPADGSEQPYPRGLPQAGGEQPPHRRVGGLRTRAAPLISRRTTHRRGRPPRAPGHVAIRSSADASFSESSTVISASPPTPDSASTAVATI